MAKDNSPEVDKGGTEKKGEKQRLVLLLLLLIIAVTGYLYFFTGVIKPRDESSKPVIPQVSQVKKPLPPRQPEQEESKETLKQSEDKKDQGTVKTTQKAQQPVTKPQEDTVKKDASVPKKEPAKPAEQPKAAPVEKKVAKPAEPKKTEAASAEKPPESKPSAIPQKEIEPPAAKGVKTPADNKKAEKSGANVQKADSEKKVEDVGKPLKKTVAVSGSKGKYTLMIGEFVQDKNYQAVQEKLASNGIKPLVKTTLQKPQPMNRLMCCDFGDYDSAAAKLEILKKLSSDAFFLEKDGRYFLYTGSYFSKALVESETKRLSEKGVKIEVQKVEVPVTIVKLSAGKYADKAEAVKAAERLKKIGISAKVISQE